MLPVLLTRCWPSEGAARKGRGSQEAQEQSSYKAQEVPGSTGPARERGGSQEEEARKRGRGEEMQGQLGTAGTATNGKNRQEAKEQVGK